MSKKALYVEDNYMNFLLVKKIMQKNNVLVERAEDASAAMEKLKKSKPDVILMDLHLPGMDGIELSAHIKDDEDLSSIPIIGISASSIPQDRKDAEKAGFSAFIEKPLDIKKLEKAVLKILK